jgi:hypothetical protein
MRWEIWKKAVASEVAPMVVMASVQSTSFK